MSLINFNSTFLQGQLYTKAVFNQLSAPTCVSMWEAIDEAITHGLTNDGTLVLSENSKIDHRVIESIFEYFSTHKDVEKTTYKPTQIEVLTVEGGTITIFLIFGGELSTEAIFKARPDEDLERAIFQGPPKAAVEQTEQVNESNCTDFSEDFDDICGQGSTQATHNLFTDGF